MILRAFVIGLGCATAGSLCFASDWVKLTEDQEQLVEWDRADIQPYEGRKFIRRRVTFKTEVVSDSGKKIRYSLQVVSFGCTDGTQIVEGASNWTRDKQLVAKLRLGHKSKIGRYDPQAAPILATVCTTEELSRLR